MAMLVTINIVVSFLGNAHTETDIPGLSNIATITATGTPINALPKNKKMIAHIPINTMRLIKFMAIIILYRRRNDTGASRQASGEGQANSERVHMKQTINENGFAQLFRGVFALPDAENRVWVNGKLNHRCSGSN